MKKDLRQFEDLAKEIEINGKKFVPIVELAKINDVELYEIDLYESNKYRAVIEYINTSNEKCGFRISQKYDIWFYENPVVVGVSNTLQIYKKLAEWGFIPNELNETEDKTVSTFWIKPIIKKDALVEAMNKAIEDILKSEMKQNQEPIKFQKVNLNESKLYDNKVNCKQAQPPKTYTINEEQMEELKRLKKDYSYISNDLKSTCDNSDSITSLGYGIGYLASEFTQKNADFYKLLNNIRNNE